MEFPGSVDIGGPSSLRMPLPLMFPTESEKWRSAEDRTCREQQKTRKNPHILTPEKGSEPHHMCGWMSSQGQEWIMHFDIHQRGQLSTFNTTCSVIKCDLPQETDLSVWMHACWVDSALSDSLRPHGLWPRQAPLFMGVSRQEHWSGVAMPSSRGSSRFRDEPPSPTLQAEPPGEAPKHRALVMNSVSSPALPGGQRVKPEKSHPLMASWLPWQPASPPP